MSMSRGILHRERGSFINAKERNLSKLTMKMLRSNLLLWHLLIELIQLNTYNQIEWKLKYLNMKPQSFLIYFSKATFALRVKSNT